MSFMQHAAAALAGAPTKTHAYNWQLEEDRMKIVEEMYDCNSGAVGKIPLLLSAVAKASFFSGQLSLYSVIVLPLTSGAKYPRRVGIIATSEDGVNQQLVSFNISDSLIAKLEKACEGSRPTLNFITAECYTKEHFEKTLAEALATTVSPNTPCIRLAPRAANISTMKKDDGTSISYVCLDNYVLAA